jgi:hypothetical protein
LAKYIATLSAVVLSIGNGERFLAAHAVSDLVGIHPVVLISIFIILRIQSTLQSELGG